MYNQTIVFITDCLFSDLKWYRRKMGGIWYKQYYRQTEGNSFPAGSHYFWNRLEIGDNYIINVAAIEDHRISIASYIERGQRPPIRKESRPRKSAISSNTI